MQKIKKIQKQKNNLNFNRTIFSSLQWQTPAHVLFCEYFKIFKNIFTIECLWLTPSAEISWSRSKE